MTITLRLFLSGNEPATWPLFWVVLLAELLLTYKLERWMNRDELTRLLALSVALIVSVGGAIFMALVIAANAGQEGGSDLLPLLSLCVWYYCAHKIRKAYEIPAPSHVLKRT